MSGLSRAAVQSVVAKPALHEISSAPAAKPQRKSRGRQPPVDRTLSKPTKFLADVKPESRPHRAQDMGGTAPGNGVRSRLRAASQDAGGDAYRVVASRA